MREWRAIPKNESRPGRLVAGGAVLSWWRLTGNRYYVTGIRDFGMLSIDGLKTLFMKIPAHVLCYLLGQAERVNWM